MPLTCRSCKYTRPHSIKNPGLACPLCHTPYPTEDLECQVTTAEQILAAVGVVCAVTVGALPAIGLVLLLKDNTPDRPTETASRPTERKTAEQIVAELDRMPWVDEYHAGIAQALGRKKITGCGSIRFKLMPDATSEYMVECSDRYDRKTGYLVWPNTGGVIGPIDLDR